MSAGLAVAGTDIDAIRSAIGPAGTPFLAPPKDPEALAGVILKLADDPILRVTIGAENRQRVRNEYGADRMCHETIDVLKDLLTPN